MCGYPMVGSFTEPTTNWRFHGKKPDRECCYDSDNDGVLDTNYNPGGRIAAGVPYVGWPKTRSSVWGNCSRACWELAAGGLGMSCVVRPSIGCGNFSVSRPVCGVGASHASGSGSGSGDDADDADAAAYSSSAAPTPAKAPPLCNGKRDPKFCALHKASRCGVLELGSSCPVLCAACPATTWPPWWPGGGDAGPTPSDATPAATQVAPTDDTGRKDPTGGGGKLEVGPQGREFIWAGAGAGAIILVVGAAWLVQLRLRRRQSTRIKAARLSICADRPGHTAMNAAFVEDIELDIVDDDDDNDDEMVTFDGTDAPAFDGRVRQHGELTFTPQSEL